MGIDYLLVRVHIVKPAFVAGSTALFGDVLYLLMRAIGEVSGVGVGCHDRYLRTRWRQ